MLARRMTRLTCLFGLLLLVRTSSACGSVGGTDDSRIITNPTFSWRMNPPVAWTYPSQYAEQTVGYFPGQPLTQVQAQTTANGDITAAALQALADSNIPTNGVRVTAQYTVTEVDKCISVAGVAPAPTTNNIGARIGIVQQGAVIQIATLAVALDPAMCAMGSLGTTPPTREDYIVNGAVQIQGVTLSGLQARQVASQLMVNLNFNSRVRFVDEIRF